MDQYKKEILVPQKQRRRRHYRHHHHHLPIVLQGKSISYLFTRDGKDYDRSLQCKNNPIIRRSWIQSRNNHRSISLLHQQRNRHHRRLQEQQQDVSDSKQQYNRNDGTTFVESTIDTQFTTTNKINHDTDTTATTTTATNDASSISHSSTETDTTINHPSSSDETKASAAAAAINDIQIIPLYQGYGTHYVDLWCGTPIPQRQTMIVDTGSSTTAFACTPYCTPQHCGHIGQYHPLYKPIESKTFHKVNHCNDCTIGECILSKKKTTKIMSQHDHENIYHNNNNPNFDTNDNNTTTMEYECIWNTAYQEGSNWTAFEAIDQCYIGGLHNKPILMNELINNNNNNNVNDNSNNDATTTTTTTTTTTKNNNNGIDPYNAAKTYTFTLQFGCQIELNGNFRTQDTAGIMGFNIGINSIYNQMYSQNLIHQRTFALCMLRPTTNNNKKVIPSLSNENQNHYKTNQHNTLLHSDHPAGIMTLGGTYKQIHHHPMIYTTMDVNDHIGLYTTQLQSIYLRSSGIGDNSITDIVPISLSNIQNSDGSNSISNIRKVIIDSGTTDTYLLQQLSEPFREAWMNIYGQPYTNDPMKLTDDELKQLPTIIFQFQGEVTSNHDIYLQDTLAIFDHLAISIDMDHPYDVLLIVPPSHYMEYQDDIDMYISGIYFDEPDGSNNVLGANIMMQHDIYFDIENSRIGFAESDCNYTQVVTPYVEKATTSGTKEKAIITPTIDLAKDGYTTISMLRVRTTTINNSIDPWQNSIMIPSLTLLLSAAVIVGILRYGYNRIKVVATIERTHIVRSPPRRGRRRQQQLPQQQEQPQLLQRRTSRIVHRSTSHDSADFFSLNNTNKSYNSNNNAMVVAMTNLITSSSSSFYQGQQQQQQRTRRLSYSDDDYNGSTTMMISSDSSTLSENDYDTTTPTTATTTTSNKKEIRRGALLRSRSHQVPS